MRRQMVLASGVVVLLVGGPLAWALNYDRDVSVDKALREVNLITTPTKGGVSTVNGRGGSSDGVRGLEGALDPELDTDALAKNPVAVVTDVQLPPFRKHHQHELRPPRFGRNEDFDRLSPFIVDPPGSRPGDFCLSVVCPDPDISADPGLQPNPNLLPPDPVPPPTPPGPPHGGGPREHTNAR